LMRPATRQDLDLGRAIPQTNDQRTTFVERPEPGDLGPDCPVSPAR
jgi:hypothetical protein